jgi:hypothetical protein
MHQSRDSTHLEQDLDRIETVGLDNSSRSVIRCTMSRENCSAEPLESILETHWHARLSAAFAADTIGWSWLRLRL